MTFWIIQIVLLSLSIILFIAFTWYWFKFLRKPKQKIIINKELCDECDGHLFEMLKENKEEESDYY